MQKSIKLAVCVLLIMGCDRLKRDDAARVQIQLPVSSSAVKESLISQSVSVSSSGVEPTGFTGTRPFNCYLVAFSGPEEGLRRNVCTRSDGSTVFQPRYIGNWQGPAPEGKTLSIDVPPGQDRVIYVVGFYVSDITQCIDMRAPEFNGDALSSPYLLAEMGGLSFKSGEVVDLPAPMKYDINNRFDTCKGPDFPERSSKNIVPTKLILNKDWFPYNATLENSCQSVAVRFVNDLGEEGSLADPTTLSITSNGTALNMYADYATCSANGATSTSIVLAANTRNSQIVFKTPSSSTSTLAIAATSDKFPGQVATLSLTNATASAKGLEVVGPNRILPNICYPYDLYLRTFTGSQDTSSSSPQNLTYTSGTGFDFYADATCSTPASPVTFSPYTANVSLFGKIAAAPSTVASVTLAMPGYLSTTAKIQSGYGTPAIARIELRGDNMGPALNVCYSKPYEVQLYNEQGTSVITPAAFTIGFLNPMVNFQFYENPGCSTPTNGNLSTVMNAGDYSKKIYIKPVTAGLQPLGATAPGLLFSQPYNINVSP
jgi:hypothetical protein